MVCKFIWIFYSFSLQVLSKFTTVTPRGILSGKYFKKIKLKYSKFFDGMASDLLKVY